MTALAVTGCGGGGGGDEPSEDAYFKASDTFCGTVATAAAQVSKDTSAVQADRKADRARVVKVVTASLGTFAQTTETALDTLEKTDVPNAFTAYQDATSAGFRKFIATLRATAKAARADGTAPLTQLGPKLNAIKLPDPPKAITANAKACASFTPVAG